MNKPIKKFKKIKKKKKKASKIARQITNEVFENAVDKGYISLDWEDYEIFLK
ncbi:MAG TPA: hypothetical protein VIH27_01195 [Nitrososphaerales archaeon]